MSANFNKVIHWDDENFLRMFIKEELKIRVNIGIENKRTQLLDNMNGVQLSRQLQFLKQNVTNETNKIKKNWLQKLVNHVEVEASDNSHGSNSSSLSEDNCTIIDVSDTEKSNVSDSLSDEDNLSDEDSLIKITEEKSTDDLNKWTSLQSTNVITCFSRT